MRVAFFKISLLITACFMIMHVDMSAQSKAYWQQKVNYTMDIDMDVDTYQYKGKQTLVYTNNSPDELNKVFYHLYFNAFQPNSQMDARLKTIKDPDGRMVRNLGTRQNPKYESRISKLKPNEIGYIKVNSLRQNGVLVQCQTVGTVLEVVLNKPIKSGESATFTMDFEAQVPVQIRRNGRNNKEGVALSMAQWYPKMAEYDVEGWHTPPYIAREFHGVWGDFDVTIHIDKKYTVGGTGKLQNPQEVGHGYEDKKLALRLPKGKKLTWNFKGTNIHDFTWAADPNYQHDKYTMQNGIELHFLYKKSLQQNFKDNWKKLQPKTAKLMEFYSEHVGQYPYKQYSVIQGGDGGMEYAQCTLITGERTWGSLFGVTAHEMAHTWFQFLLATNESKHPWMDEGFTVYISNLAENFIANRNEKQNVHAGSYQGYRMLVTKGYEEPLSTHADRYNTNWAYGVGSYSKGNIFLSQLAYVIGQENLMNVLKNYFKQFSFKHPMPNDFKRVAEKTSGIHLDWYLNEWTQTTHTIDYGVQLEGNTIALERLGKMPMPIDLQVTYKDGSVENFYIPLEMMRGAKPTKATLLKDWGWAYPTYTFQVGKAVSKIVIDPSGLMADVNLSNNTFKLKEGK